MNGVRVSELSLNIRPQVPSETGEGKRRNEFAEWHVTWPAEWHNYAKYYLGGE